MIKPLLIKFDFKGIEMNLRIGAWTKEAYGQAMAAIIQSYPNMAFEELGICSAATLLYLAYFNHCETTGMPAIYTWEDFLPVVKAKLLNPETERELVNIFEQYLKHNNNVK